MSIRIVLMQLLLSINVEILPYCYYQSNSLGFLSAICEKDLKPDLNHLKCLDSPVIDPNEIDNQDDSIRSTTTR